MPSSGNVRLDLSDNATINIFGTSDEFTNTPNQAEVDRYQGYIDDAHDPMSNQALTAWGGTADPIITLQACPEDPDPLAALLREYWRHDDYDHRRPSDWHCRVT